MGSQPEQDMHTDMYIRAGVHVTAEQVSAARKNARRILAERDAEWTPDRWAELDQRINAA